MIILKWTGLMALGVGVVAFLAGFVGPMIFSESNQGPLLGIFLTGPLGVVLGAVIGCCIGLFKARRCREQHGFPVTPEPRQDQRVPRLREAGQRPLSGMTQSGWG